MDITNDEFIAMLQNTENGRLMLENASFQDMQTRYAQRDSLNFKIDPTEHSRLQNMSMEEFENLRKIQIGQLYNAYVTAHTRGSSSLLRLNHPNATDIDSIRRVTGDKPGLVYNNGILALSHDDISLLSSLVEIARKRDDVSPYSSTNISTHNLYHIVNETQAIKRAVAQEKNQPLYSISINTIATQTNAVKRSFSHLIGNNIFNIKDFEDCAFLQKRGFISRISHKLFEKLDKMINPEKERNDENRYGNKSFEDDLGR